MNTGIYPAGQLLVNQMRCEQRLRSYVPGVSTSIPVTLRFLQTPNVPLPKPPPVRLPAPDPAVKATQRRLIALGYMVSGDDDGRFGPATQNAILVPEVGGARSDRSTRRPDQVTPRQCDPAFACHPRRGG
jgi:hypothetical protein